MRELCDMTLELAKEKNKSFVDYIGVWWDDTGSWR